MLVAAAIRDVTERKQTEQALKEARREAEHANLAKSRFLATASHDLRQPLQTLGLLNGALRRMINDEEYREILEQQELAVDAMSRLLNALLDISKLESGAIKLELTRLRTSARCSRSCGANLPAWPAARGCGSRSTRRVTACIRIRRWSARCCAISFRTPSSTRTQGSVELRCENGGAKLRIEVRDTGVGIAADQVASFSTSSTRSASRPTARATVMAWALSIVQRIARLLDLKVDVESVPGKGSSFRSNCRSAQHAGRRSRHRDCKRRRTRGDGGMFTLLLVEDEPGVRNAMRMLLEIEGYHVTTAATAAEALELLRDGVDFDLLVTDYHLEGGSTGTQVIAAAREILGDSFKAILVTGDTSSAVREMQGDAICASPASPSTQTNCSRS